MVVSRVTVSNPDGGASEFGFFGEPRARVDSGPHIEIYGNLVGSLHPAGSLISAERTLNRLQSESLESIGRTLAGNCVVLSETKDTVEMFASLSSAGFWVYEVSPSDLRICFSEGCAWRCAARLSGNPPDQATLAQLISSHQLALRPPFSTPWEKLMRLPPGMGLRLDQTKSSFEVFTSLPPISASGQEKSLAGMTASLLLAIDVTCSGPEASDIGLFFSGGLDSSILLAALHHTGKAPAEVVYRSYSRVHPFVDQIASHFGQRVRVEEPDFDRPVSATAERVRAAAECGLGVVSNSFGIPFLGGPSNQGVMLSGQNADTLYMIDAFAPGTGAVGTRRAFELTASTRKRYLYSEHLLGLPKPIRSALASVLLVREGWVEASKSVMLRDLFGGGQEHKIPWRKDESAQLEGWQSDYEKLLGLLIAGLNVEHFSGHQTVKALKIFRFLRTVQNCNVNVQNQGLGYGLHQRMPFSENPMVQTLISQRITNRDVLLPKSRFHALFESLAGVRHQDLIRDAQSHARVQPFTGMNAAAISYGNRVLEQIRRRLSANESLIDYLGDSKVGTILGTPLDASSEEWPHISPSEMAKAVNLGCLLESSVFESSRT